MKMYVVHKHYRPYESYVVLHDDGIFGCYSRRSAEEFLGELLAASIEQEEAKP